MGRSFNMKMIGSKPMRFAAAAGVLGATACVVLSGGATRPVRAASAPVAAVPQSAQSTAPKDQPTPGVPPNLDWSIFLPQGDGQFQVSVYCVSCHSAKVIVTRRSDEAGWAQIVHRMIDMHQAAVQGDDVATISKYLGTTLSSTTPALALPIAINTAPKEELAYLGLLTLDDIQKIVDARAKSKIADYAALKALVGDKSLDKYKNVLSFN
jgi:hypothetical protein